MPNPRGASEGNVTAGDKDRPLLAAALLIAGAMFIPLGDAFAQLAAQNTSYVSGELAWMRFVIGVGIVLPIAMLRASTAIRTWKFWVVQSVRGALIAGTIFCIITAIDLIPLGDAYGAFFIGPAIATLLGYLVLKEAVRPLEWIAVIGGFIGVAIVLQPGNAIVPGHAWALMAGALYGSYFAATRWAQSSAPAMTQLAGQLCVGMVLLSPLALDAVMSKPLQSPELLLGSGVASVVGNLLIIMAFANARAAFLSPLVYCQLIAAVFYGWAMASQTPQPSTLVGIAIIFVAGLAPILGQKTIASRDAHR
ncbi:MAG: DMT family transporter [Pseudomonadota bacterium]